MAVENKYVDANIVAGKKARSLNTDAGAKTVTMRAIASIAAADDDDSIYRLFANVPSHLVPINIHIACSAVTGGTDYDLGLYKTRLGAVVDKDVLMDGQTMATAINFGTANNTGLKDVALADTNKTLAALSGQAKPDSEYDICLTANTVGSAAGTIVVTATFADI